MSHALAQSHYIRQVILRSLQAAQPFGVCYAHIVEGIQSAPNAKFIIEATIQQELDWLEGKGLIGHFRDEALGGDAENRFKLEPKGVTFLAKGQPWDKLEVLD